MSAAHQSDMQSASKPEGSEPMQPPRASKDRRGSASGSFSLASPPSVNPDPAYIAASAASHIVTGDNQNQTEDWFEDKGNQFNPETAVVSSTSLALVNAFLDQLLYNFLASARSTSIASLRPAVSEVLRPRLAKDAINGADEELYEFLGGGDEEELSAFHNGLEPRGPWDLNLVWRRTRLRCMVYTRLGDMEEEDEETFIEREQLDEAGQGYRRLSRGLSVVSPAAAIFLTSILEFVGEQALMVAGEAAHTRVEARRLKTPESEDPRTNKQRVVVEDIDMQKIAFNTTLGRLWRSWKKRVRPPSMLGIKNLSRDYARSNGAHSHENDPTNRSTLDSEVEVVNSGPGDTARPSTADAENSLLSELPPSASTKVNDGEDSTSHFLTGNDHQGHKTTDDRRGRRPSSMVLYPRRSIDSSAGPSNSVMQQRRSSSLPALHAAPYISLSSEISSTPREAPASRNTSSSSVHKQGEPRPATPSLGRDEPTTVTTSYDGRTDSDSDAMPSDYEQSKRGSRGMSEEEFDRQMLQLVKEMRPQRTSDLLKDERRIGNKVTLEKSLPSGSRETDSKADAFDGATPHTYAELPANRGIDQSTLAYWRGAGGSPCSTALQKPSEGSEGASSEPRSKLPGGQQRRPTSEGDGDYGRMWERQMPYFYRGPSTSDNNQNEAIVQGPTKELQYDTPQMTPVRYAASRAETDNGAPPLTPLRELMEAAHDTSDEASSVTPSQDASRSNHASSDQYQISDIPRSGSSLSQALPQARPASKLSELRSQLPAVNTNTDHAAVQRVLPSPVSAREPLTPVGRTSTSSSRGLRLLQTSSSATSQVSQKLRGIVGRDSSDLRRPGTPRDSSEGSGSFISDKPSLKTPRAGDAQKSFDQLIKSDETIQYTLTPQNMREMEVIAFLTRLLAHALISVSHIIRETRHLVRRN